MLSGSDLHSSWGLTSSVLLKMADMFVSPTEMECWSTLINVTRRMIPIIVFMMVSTTTWAVDTATVAVAGTLMFVKTEITEGSLQQKLANVSVIRGVSAKDLHSVVKMLEDAVALFIPKMEFKVAQESKEKTGLILF